MQYSLCTSFCAATGLERYIGVIVRERESELKAKQVHSCLCFPLLISQLFIYFYLLPVIFFIKDLYFHGRQALE